MSYRDPGRHVSGLAAICFCALTVAWRDFNGWQQIGPLGNVPHREIVVYLAAAIWLFGGVAIQWHRTARIGAGALGLLYLTFALMWAPFIVAEPLSYDRQLSEPGNPRSGVDCGGLSRPESSGHHGQIAGQESARGALRLRMACHSRPESHYRSRLHLTELHRVTLHGIVAGPFIAVMAG